MGYKKILCGLVLVLISTFSNAVELTEEQFKKGYIAYDIINGEIQLIQFMVEKCNEHDSKLGNVLVKKLDEWKTKNSEMILKLVTYRKAMMEVIKKEDDFNAKMEALLSQEKERMNERFKRPKATFNSQSAETINNICESMSSKFSAGIVKMQDIRPTQYKILMSLGI